MIHDQTTKTKNAGFTLVEVMVVILIIALLLLVGNYSDFTKRRERAKLEEVAVQLITLIDQNKVDALLGKTEGGTLVRKRKINIDFSDNTLTYDGYIDLIEDNENLYCGVVGNNEICPDGISTNTPNTTKTWSPIGLNVNVWNCDNNSVASSPTSLGIEFQGDTINFLPANESIKHIVIQLSRQGAYREIHIDRRTGVTYEREVLGNIISCI